jgi:hypothetical protein
MHGSYRSSLLPRRTGRSLRRCKPASQPAALRDDRAAPMVAMPTWYGALRKAGRYAGRCAGRSSDICAAVEWRIDGDIVTRGKL